LRPNGTLAQPELALPTPDEDEVHVRKESVLRPRQSNKDCNPGAVAGTITSKQFLKRIIKKPI
jgi:hypothetical protein